MEGESVPGQNIKQRNLEYDYCNRISYVASFNNYSSFEPHASLSELYEYNYVQSVNRIDDGFV